MVLSHTGVGSGFERFLRSQSDCRIAQTNLKRTLRSMGSLVFEFITPSSQICFHFQHGGSAKTNFYFWGCSNSHPLSCLFEWLKLGRQDVVLPITALTNALERLPSRQRIQAITSC